KYPEVDELVMVQVRQIAEMSAYVKLLTYDNIEGTILLSESSRRLMRSIRKLIQKRVSPEGISECEECFVKSKTVASIMRRVASKLADNSQRLALQLTKLRAHIELTCSKPARIDAIERAMKTGEALSSPTVPVKGRSVIPPFYVLDINATDKHAGLANLEAAIEAIKNSIAKKAGDLNVKMRPKAVSETEETELVELMAKAGKENAQISGDEADDRSDDGEDI
ncbi:eIF-2-alpha, C-terminal domain-containing protein, partial [Clavulina sp. PMI_390]